MVLRRAEAARPEPLEPCRATRPALAGSRQGLLGATVQCALPSLAGRGRHRGVAGPVQRHGRGRQPRARSPRVRRSLPAVPPSLPPGWRGVAHSTRGQPTGQPPRSEVVPLTANVHLERQAQSAPPLVSQGHAREPLHGERFSSSERRWRSHGAAFLAAPPAGAGGQRAREHGVSDPVGRRRPRPAPAPWSLTPSAPLLLSTSPKGRHDAVSSGVECGVRDHDVRVRDGAETRDSNHAACRVSPAALHGHRALDHRAVLGAVKALRPRGGPSGP